MRVSRYPVATVLLWLAWVATSAGLVVWGRTLQRLERAGDLYWAGSTDGSLAAFRDLAERFRRHPWLARLAPGERDRALHNYLRLLYLREDYDSVIIQGEAALRRADGAAPVVRYWLGSAYYRKAISGKSEEEDALAWLRRAGEQFRSAVVDASGDWDVKYNHELVQRLLHKLDQQQQQRVFDVLRPRDKPAPRPPSKKIG